MRRRTHAGLTNKRWLVHERQLRLAVPAGAISDVLPWSTEPNTQRGGTLVHTIILFSGSCEAGKAAARTLHVKLLGDVRPLFYVPAPRARSLFGNVYMVTVGFPYLVSRAQQCRGVTRPCLAAVCAISVLAVAVVCLPSRMLPSRMVASLV